MPPDDSSPRAQAGTLEVVPGIQLATATGASWPNAHNDPALSATEASTTPVIGLGDTLADKYRIDELLGRGGMGEVFAATHLVLGHRVAIKVLRSKDSTAGERFLREARICARLASNHVPHTFDLGRLPAGVPYIVMECLEGEDLAHVIARGPLSADHAASYVLQACRALVEAHAAGVIHRDLKPANLFVATRKHGPPVVKVLDFGICKFIEDLGSTGTHASSQGEVLLGSPLYMSPEQLRGLKEVDARTDIWSLGVVLYELLTGRRPFHAPTLFALSLAIARDAPVRPSALRLDLPEGLDEVVLRCLEKDASARFGSAQSLLDALVPFASPALSGSSEDAVVATPPRRHNLPAEVTSFVGREEELEQIVPLLRDDHVRLVTLLGPGGMGKSRLAMEIAKRIALSEMALFANGAFLVQLAPVSSSDLIVSTIAEAVRFRFDSGARPKERLLAYLQEKRLLLVLDNFEHLLAGADLIGEILERAAGVKVLVTSRERLGLNGETLFALSGMDLPVGDSEHFDCGAVRLFVQSARLASPRLQLDVGQLEQAARICRRVEGMPLGIVLAAAWLDTLSVEEIADEIDRSLDLLESQPRDPSTRQASIRAVFDQSWNLLDADQRVVFSMLSVFRGGFTREAALAVAGARLPTLSTLIHKSLLRRDPENGRYEIHELLRQYGEARLCEAPALRGQALDAHSRYVADFLHERYERLQSAHPRRTQDEIAAEIDNVRAAWSRMLECEQLENLGHAMPALGRFYAIRALLAEHRTIHRQSYAAAQNDFGDLVERLDRSPLELTGERARLVALALCLQVDLRDAPPLPSHREALFRALSLLASDEHARDRAIVMVTAGSSVAWTGRPQEGIEMAEQGLALCRAAGDEIEVARALFRIGLVNQYVTGDTEKAIREYEESVAIQRRLGLRLFGLDRLGDLYCVVGRYAEGLAFLTEGLAYAEELSLGSSKIRCLLAMSSAERLMGNYELAEARARSAYRLSSESGHRYSEMWSRHCVGDALVARGRLEEAAVYYTAAYGLGEELRDELAIAIAKMNLGDVALHRGDFAEVRRLQSEALAYFEIGGNSVHVGWAADKRAHAAILERQYDVARRCYQRVMALERKSAPFQLGVLAGFALLLTRLGQAARAVEILAFVQHHPLTDHPTRLRRVAPTLAELEGRLSSDEFAAARGRGTELDMKDVLAMVRRVSADGLS